MIWVIVRLAAWTALAVLFYGIAIFMTTFGDCLGVPGCEDRKQQRWLVVTLSALAIYAAGVVGLLWRRRE